MRLRRPRKRARNWCPQPVTLVGALPGSPAQPFPALRSHAQARVPRPPRAQWACRPCACVLEPKRPHDAGRWLYLRGGERSTCTTAHAHSPARASGWDANHTPRWGGGRLPDMPETPPARAELCGNAAGCDPRRGRPGPTRCTARPRTTRTVAPPPALYKSGWPRARVGAKVGASALPVGRPPGLASARRRATSRHKRRAKDAWRALAPPHLRWQVQAKQVGRRQLAPARHVAGRPHAVPPGVTSRRPSPHGRALRSHKSPNKHFLTVSVSRRRRMPPAAVSSQCRGERSQGLQRVQRPRGNLLGTKNMQV